MLRNYLATALRNLIRNRLYAGINILGLAIGFAAAMFAAAFVTNELTYEQWVPDQESIYTVATSFIERGVRRETLASLPAAAAWLKLDFPEIQSASRLLSECSVLVQRGDMPGTMEGEGMVGCPTFASVDPEFFVTIPFPRVAGDLATALDEPDGVVLTRSMARKYFGRDAPLGEAIELNHHPMKVTAVIADWPSNTEFSEGFFISSRASFSGIRQWEERRSDPEAAWYDLLSGETFVRLKPGASIAAVQAEMAAFSERHFPKTLLGGMTLRLMPLASRHLGDLDDVGWRQQRAGRLNAIYTIIGTGVLILLAAAINFVNGMTARAARRAVEIGVRKTAGAARIQLALQFLGESVIYALLGLALASVLVTVLTRALRNLLDGVAVAPWTTASDFAIVVGIAVLIGLLAGMYPALILSRLRPTVALRATVITAVGSGVVRRALVTAQFAILVGLVIVEMVMHRQFAFAMNEGLRYNLDQLLVMDNRGHGEACAQAMKTEIRALPGVRAAGCSAGGIDGGYSTDVVRPGESQISIAVGTVDYDAFDALGLRPIAGRFFSPQFGDDTAGADSSFNPNVVINEALARAMGFTSPSDAIDRTILWQRIISDPGRQETPMPPRPSRIIGVIADYPYFVGTGRVEPHIFVQDPNAPGRLFVRLRGRDIPETLAAIDGIWAKLGDPKWPTPRHFMAQEIEKGYRTMVQQARLIGALAAVELFISGLGIFGFAAFTAERRTKEIGVRKAMGASRVDILRLVLWDFAKPVLVANLIAWPLAYVIGQRWLQGYAYHVDLQAWTFLGASVLALAIALLTVMGHALLVARAKPIAALRYE